MASKSKIKGKAGERELSKIFKNVFGGSFIRVPSSGAFIGGKNKFRVSSLSENQIRNSKGDIIPPDYMPNLVLECKFYSNFPFHLLLSGDDVPLLDSWIEQTTEVLDKEDVWFLCWKINRKGWYITYEPNMYPDFILKHFNSYKKYIITDLKNFLVDNKSIILKLSK